MTSVTDDFLVNTKQESRTNLVVPVPPSALMLDPSLLLAPATALAVRRAFEEDDLPPVFVSDTLVRLLSENESLEPLALFYAPFSTPWKAAQSEDLGFVIERREIKPFSAPADLAAADDVYSRFHNISGGNELLAAVWIEEWLFLHTQSWVASRTKRTFTTFKRAGDVAIEFGRDSFERLARRTLRIPNADIPEPLARSQKLRAVTKWVAAGGLPLTALLNPAVGISLGVAGNLFALFDP